MAEKTKASNFRAKVLRIGGWMVVGVYEGDLVAKIYFSKRKFLLEILNYGLMRKIEIDWDNISAIRADYGNAQHDTLQVEVRDRFPFNSAASFNRRFTSVAPTKNFVERRGFSTISSFVWATYAETLRFIGCIEQLRQPPLFFHEVDPTPRRHAKWDPCPDFTGRNALTFRRHSLEFPNGTLRRHYELLLSHDIQLKSLSQMPFPSHHSLYFNMDHQMHEFPREASMQGSEVPPLHNLPSRDCYPPQLDHTGHPMSITGLRHIGNSGCLDPPALAFSPIPLLEANSEIMAMDHSGSEDKFPPVDGSAAMNTPLSQNTPAWDQEIPCAYGNTVDNSDPPHLRALPDDRELPATNPPLCQSSPTCHQEIKYQDQGLPCACAYQVDSFDPQQVYVGESTASIESALLDDRELPSTDETDAYLMELWREIGQAGPYPLMVLSPPPHRKNMLSDSKEDHKGHPPA